MGLRESARAAVRSGREVIYPCSRRTVKNTVRLLFLLIPPAVIGCAEHHPDAHFPQRLTLEMNRDQLLRKLQRHNRPGGCDFDIAFILDDGQTIPYLTERYRSSNECLYTKDELDQMGYLAENKLPNAYFASRRWRWRPGYGALQSYEYVFNDRDLVEKVEVTYHNEGATVLQAILGGYWLGSISSATILVITYRRTIRHRPTQSLWRAAAAFYLDDLRDGSIALFVGMVAVWLAAAVVDWEILLAATVMFLPLLASLMLYYCMLTRTGSRVLSLCAFFALPTILGALCFENLYFQTQIIM